MANKKHRYAGQRPPRDLNIKERAERIVNTGEITLKDLKKTLR